jgi:dCMP deaminase
MSDLFNLALAYRQARNSPDPSTQNGAVIMDGNGFIVGQGCNTFPKKVAATAERLVSPVKYKFIEHAERNAIYDAVFRGHSLAGATMYCAWAACSDCARAIIQAGIVELVTHDIPQHHDQGSWADSIAAGMTMLREADVIVRSTPGKIGGHKIRFNGAKINV